jgi:hypothetical protein
MYDHIRDYYRLEFAPGDIVRCDEIHGYVLGMVQREDKSQSHYVQISYQIAGKLRTGPFHPRSVRKISGADIEAIMDHGVHHGNCDLESWDAEFTTCGCGLFQLLKRLGYSDTEKAKNHVSG